MYVKINPEMLERDGQDLKGLISSLRQDIDSMYVEVASLNSVLKEGQDSRKIRSFEEDSNYINDLMDNMEEICDGLFYAASTYKKAQNIAGEIVNSL